MRQIAICLLALMAMAGCSTTNYDWSDSADTAPQVNLYHDFDDVQVPVEMEIDPDRSVILETQTMKSGVLAFSGKVTRISLTDYFINNMARDNWTMRSAFKSSRSVLLFEKVNRFCIITITDQRFGTDCEIWVLPKQAGEALNSVPEMIIRDPGLPGTQSPATPNTFGEPPVENMPFPIKEQELPNY